MSILVLDNYDSFTYNLVHALQKHSAEPVAVYRNDAISLEEVDAFDKILLSPGPGLPAEAGLLKPLIEAYAPSKCILGICLGQQAIAAVFGASLHNTRKVSHGVATPTTIVDRCDPLFKGLPRVIQTARYHSWVVSPQDFPTALKVTARGPKGEIMALRHRHYNLSGLQFHPESILTPLGDQIIQNWLRSASSGL